MIPVARPDIGDEEIAAVTEVLRSGMIAQGKRVAELEERWAEFVGVRHAIAMANGTLALMAIYAAMELGPGDEVITVSHSFNATGSTVLSTGATPVFIDIEPDTYNMDAGRIEAAITPRTKAICPVHLFGLPADMAAIMDDRRATRPHHRRGRVPGPRRDLRRSQDGQLRTRGVQPVRHEEHDHRRGRVRHDR